MAEVILRLAKCIIQSTPTLKMLIRWYSSTWQVGIQHCEILGFLDAAKYMWSIMIWWEFQFCHNHALHEKIQTDGSPCDS